MATAFFSSILPPLFPGDERKHIARRTKATWRRVLNEGVVALFFAVFLAFIAAISLRVLLLHQAAAELEEQTLFTQTFGVEQEQRELPYPGVIAGLLGTINSNYQELHCRDNDPSVPCRRKEAILNSVTRLFALAVDKKVKVPGPPITAENCGKELVPETLNALLQLWSGDPSDQIRRCAWIARSYNALLDVRAATPARLERCPAMDDEKQKPWTYAVGIAACQLRRGTDEAETLVPAQLSRHRVGDLIRGSSKEVADEADQASPGAKTNGLTTAKGGAASRPKAGAAEGVKAPSSPAQAAAENHASDDEIVQGQASEKKGSTGEEVPQAQTEAGTSVGGSAVARKRPLRAADEWDRDAEEVGSVSQLLDVGLMNAASIPAPPPASPGAGVNGKDDKVESSTLIDHAELRQVYFISPDNLLRIWAYAGDPLMELPRTRFWAAAAYLRPFVDKGVRASVKTRAYLDVGGNGLVTTECRPLWLGTGKDSVFIGAVCADMMLNIQANTKLREKLTSNRLLHIEPVTISTRNGERRVKADIGPDDTKWHYEAAALENAIFVEIDRSGLVPLSQTTFPIRIEQSTAFVVPTGRIDEGSIQALVVSPERPTPNWKIILWSALLAVSVAGYLVCTLVWGFAKKRGEDASRNDLVIFRSLQTGVIETLSGGEQIVRANDRAEEILGVRLPKKRSPHDSRAITFTEIYDLALEVVNDPWPDARDGTGDDATGETGNRPGERKSDVEYRVLSPTDIYSRRSEGRTTRYWIHLDNREKVAEEIAFTKSWVSIQAGPLVRQSGTYLPSLVRSWFPSRKSTAQTSVGSFGTVDRGSRRRAEELDNILQQWIANNEPGAVDRGQKLTYRPDWNRYPPRARPSDKPANKASKK